MRAPFDYIKKTEGEKVDSKIFQRSSSIWTPEKQIPTCCYMKYRLVRQIAARPYPPQHLLIIQKKAGFDISEIDESEENNKA
jgi:hypothetical protein